MLKIGVAISGGGHRASLFGLGVLMYLADAGENRNVVTISSVSGGSLTNAFLGLNGDYRAHSAGEFRNLARKLASQIANRGTLFGWIGTKVYLGVLVVSGLAAFAIWLLPFHWLARLGLFIGALALWEVLLLRRRGEICGRAYAATILRRPDGRPGLSSLSRDGIDHVICATHLHAGEHIYFSGKFVYAYRFGWGTPGGLPLHAAVQASTALPGAFPPRWLRSSRFSFMGESKPPPLLALSDGGVYDNMADQWLSGMARRSDVTDDVQRPKEFIIVNASASMQMQPVWQMRLPIVGEVAALKRNSSIMYDNSASLRKRDLIDRFDVQAATPPSAEGGGERWAPIIGSPGALLDIASDPFTAARFFADKDDTWPDRAARSRAALTKKPDDWQSDALWAATVKTSLSRLGVDTSARLIRHGYGLAAMNLHVFLDTPLRDIPPLEDFERMCR